jgi:hypothetical protein
MHEMHVPIKTDMDIYANFVLHLKSIVHYEKKAGVNFLVASMGRRLAYPLMTEISR